MNIDLLFSIFAGILLVVGFLGTFVPVLPGAPLAWGGLLLCYFSSYNEISIFCLVITAIFAILVSILDNFAPVLMTKNFGGSKKAITGSTIGLIVGFFVGPIGIIAGPFFGALIGELINNQGNWNGVFKAAFGAFIGFVLGTGIKMICVFAFIFIYIASFI
jgi:uncharacterized protein YqgC (DUF456 family)